MINLNLVALVLQQLLSAQLFRCSVLLLACYMSNTEISFQDFALSFVLKNLKDMAKSHSHIWLRIFTSDYSFSWKDDLPGNSIV